MDRRLCMAIVIIALTACDFSLDLDPFPCGLEACTRGTGPVPGTIFMDPDIITASDPTTLQGLSFAGQGSRTMFDRRIDGSITVDAYLFNASFDDGLSAEIQVNPEFGSSDTALAEAQKYAEVIGRLPTALRNDVQTVWIHMGTEPFGGGNNNLLIHTGQADLYAADGILEEALVHEAAHTSLDAAHTSSSGWLAAKTADGTFISTYARNFGEDIAESFVPYLAVRYRSDRISESLADTILATIPNRIVYLDIQRFDMYPLDLADPNAPPVLQPSELCSDNLPSAIATFEDATLEAGVRIALFPQDDLACELLSGLTGLNADRRGITSLMGIQNLTGLTGLSLDGNAITDVGPLSGLTNLTGLWLDDNSITDIGPLSGLTSLLGLWLHGNAITDIGALSGLTSLTELDLRDNPNLSNIQPLLSNAGLGATSVVHLSGTRVSCEDVALLEAKRVAVVSTC